ncbi:MAG: SIS domain-containing protein [Chlamydiales bacterium]|nr:SIS domain-containing protein [Chlamydiales bacterium]
MFIKKYLIQSQKILESIDTQSLESMIRILKEVKERGGRVFFLGSGGGAGHASHAVCDFRKLGGFQAYCPSDNVSELTARINDEGWDVSMANYLLASQLNSKDCLFIFSVGGGSEEPPISMNLVLAMKTAKKAGSNIVGIVGKDGGATAIYADACMIIPTIDSQLITPHTEGMQAVLWHLLVSHPDLRAHSTKWESLDLAE